MISPAARQTGKLTGKTDGQTVGQTVGQPGKTHRADAAKFAAMLGDMWGGQALVMKVPDVLQAVKTRLPKPLFPEGGGPGDG